MATKNLVEDALIQIKNLEEVINENAKEILQSTMKEEISELVKESIKEADEDEKDETPKEDELEIEDEDEVEVDDLDSDENDDQDGMDFDGGMDFSNETPTIDLTQGATNQEVANVFKRLKDTDEVIVVRDGDNIDLTVGGEEYIIKLNEGMYMDEDEDFNPADDVIPMEEDDDTELPTGDEELEEDFDNDDMDREEMFDRIFAEMDETNEDDTETVYELEMDGEELPSGDESLEEDFDDMNLDSMNFDDVASYEDEDDSEEFEEGWMNESRKTNKKSMKPVGKGIGKAKFDYKKTTGGFKEKMKQGTKGVGMGKAKFEYKESDNKMKKVETKEAARTYGFGSKDKSRGLRKAVTPNRNLTFESYEKLVEEISSLRQKNEEYRKALNLFREKLNEVAIFNSNLAYATRLFTEHSTSKQEKINILRRFDSVDTIKESKKLYKFIKEELEGDNDKATINEAFERVVNVEPQTGSAVNLIESKTYENPQFLRMKDLMTKIIK